MKLSNNMIKRSLSFMIVFALVFAFMAPIAGFKVEAANEVNYSVKVRIEGNDSTFVKPTTINIESLDLSEYPGINKSASDYDGLRPIHAIVRALEKSGIEPKDNSKFIISMGGNYIEMINGLAGAWMYRVDNKNADLGVGDFKIKDDQEVVLYYVENWEDNTYSWFDQESIVVDGEKDFELNLIGHAGFDETTPTTSVEGATILVDGKEYKKDGQAVKTDSEGRVTLNFDKAGTYDISANKKNDKGQNIISRPYASVKVVAEKDVVNSVDLDEAIKKTLNYYKNNNPENPIEDWEAYVGLWGLNDVINKEYNWESNDPGFESNISTNETMIYAYSLLAKGKDPSNIWGGRNLFKELASQQNEEGIFTSEGKHIFSMILLDAGEKMGADVGEWNKVNRQKAIDSLLKMQNKDGSFGSFSYLDFTGWSLIALSQYRDQEEVDKAIDKALILLREKQTDTGAFDYNDGEEKGENSNSISAIIQGLVAIGEDVSDPKGSWAKDGNTPVDALLRYQKDDGSFLWKLNTNTTGPSTKQAIVALSDVKNAKSTWNRLVNNSKAENKGIVGSIILVTIVLFVLLFVLKKRKQVKNK